MSTQFLDQTVEAYHNFIGKLYKEVIVLISEKGTNGILSTTTPMVIHSRALTKDVIFNQVGNYDTGLTIRYNGKTQAIIDLMPGDSLELLSLLTSLTGEDYMKKHKTVHDDILKSLDKLLREDIKETDACIHNRSVDVNNISRDATPVLLEIIRTPEKCHYINSHNKPIPLSAVSPMDLISIILMLER